MKDTKHRRLTYDPRSVVNFSAQCDNCKIEIDIRTSILIDYVLKKGLTTDKIVAATLFNERKGQYVKSFAVEHCGFSIVMCLDTKKDTQEELLYCHKCYNNFKAKTELARKESLKTYAIGFSEPYEDQKKP